MPLGRHVVAEGGGSLRHVEGMIKKTFSIFHFPFDILHLLSESSSELKISSGEA
jgi:hypothetical protein